MLKMEFSTAERKALHYQRFYHPHPRVQMKMEAVYLKSQQLPHHEICRLCGITGNTLRAYLRDYQAGGLPQLQQLNFYCPQSKLWEQRQSLEASLKANPPATIKQARSLIITQTGLTRSPTQVRNFLLQLGLKCRRVGMLPAKAEVEKQAAFLAQELQPRLAEATAGRRKVFFVDAAHFVLAPFLGFLWSLARLFIRAPSGRQRFNVLGALDAITKEIFLVTNQTYITSLQVCDLLTQLAAASTGLPLTVVLDNARYQRCKLVIAHAASLGIELLFLPPYSPNLNLIERLWKFVKKQCLYSTYYDKFDKFKEAISDCLENASLKHKSELHSLLTLNFQTFGKAQSMTV